jgi:hypothetical protein
MILRRAIASMTFCAAAALAVPALAAEKNADAKDANYVNQEISYLQHQIDELKSEQATSAKASADKAKNYVRSPKCPDGKCVYHSSTVNIGTYFDKDDDNGPGGNLVVNGPSTHMDTAILRSVDRDMKEAAELGAPAPSFPRFTLGGQLEANAAKDNTAIPGRDKGQGSLSAANLVGYLQATPWVAGYFQIAFDPSADTTTSLGNRLSLVHAFAVIGNLSKSPLFASIGKMYVPFGHYASGAAYLAPVTYFARSNADTVTVGFQQVGDNAFHASVYGYEGIAKVKDKGDSHGYGVEGGYQFKNGDFSGNFGAGYVSNLEDAEKFRGVHNPAAGSTDPNTYVWQKAVPGANVNAVLTYKAFTWIGEYTQSVGDFDPQDVSFGTTKGNAPIVVAKPARPKMFHTELQYAFHTLAKPSFVGVGYDHTSQAVVLSLPQNRYSAFYGVSIWKHTLLTLEYDRNKYYSAKHLPDLQASGVAGTGSAPSNAAQLLGKHENVYAAVFDIYF